MKSTYPLLKPPKPLRHHENPAQSRCRTDRTLSGHAWEDTELIFQMIAVTNAYSLTFAVDVDDDGTFETTLTDYDAALGASEFDSNLSLLLGSTIDDGTVTRNVRIDADGEILLTTVTVDVFNALPSASLSGPDPDDLGIIEQGQLGTWTLSPVYDSGDDTVTSMTVDWGDGAVDTFSGVVSTLAHTYSSPGEFIIRVAATDEDDTFPLEIASVYVLPTGTDPNTCSSAALAAINPAPFYNWVMERQAKRISKDYASAHFLKDIRARWYDNPDGPDGGRNRGMWHLDAVPATRFGYDQGSTSRWMTREEARIEKRSWSDWWNNVPPRYAVSFDEELYVEYTITPNTARPSGAASGKVEVKLHVFMTTTVHDSLTNTDTVTRKNLWSSGTITGYDDTYKNPSSVTNHPSPPTLPPEIP